MIAGTVSIPRDIKQALDNLVKDWTSSGDVRRIWSKDSSLWTGKDESKYLGWLDVVVEQLDNLSALEAFRKDIADSEFKHIVLLGMGGSSLCPEVLSQSLGPTSGSPIFSVLDSIDPSQVLSLTRRINLQRTLFIVSSKSGSTLETTILYRYFRHSVERLSNSVAAGQQFVAVTDEGSKLDRTAQIENFRWVAHGVDEIGGRYSALSCFGMVPAALMGVDVERFIRLAASMRNQCLGSIPLVENPGAMLGLILGASLRTGRDKVTIIASPRISTFGAWLEQLLAESTGKQGVGLMPIDGESLGESFVYGQDRVFVYIRDEVDPDTEQDEAVKNISEAGFPVINFSLRDRYELGSEFFRWEFATAVVGAVLGINPFDQPDVESSKIETRRLTDELEEAGTLSIEEPTMRDEELELYANTTWRERFDGLSVSVDEAIVEYCTQVQEGDYFAILAYLEMTSKNNNLLQKLRHAIRDKKKVATSICFGPRFLHSTGQAHKGGRNAGVFLQITCRDSEDLAVPGSRYSFGAIKTAQARGDLCILEARGRKILRVHIVGDLLDGLGRIARAVERSLTSNK